MRPYDPADAVELSNQLHAVIRSLPPDTHPHTVMTALCALLGRGVSLLEPRDQEPALEWIIEMIRLGMQRSQ